MLTSCGSLCASDPLKIILKEGFLTAATSVLSSVLTAIGTILSSMITWAGQVLAVFTSTGNELLLFFVIAGAAYMGVNLLRKLMRF